MCAGCCFTGLQDGFGEEGLLAPNLSLNLSLSFFLTGSLGGDGTFLLGLLLGDGSWAGFFLSGLLRVDGTFLLGLLLGDGSWAGFFLSGLLRVDGTFLLGLLSGDCSWADWSEELLHQHLLLAVPPAFAFLGWLLSGWSG